MRIDADFEISAARSVDGPYFRLSIRSCGYGIFLFIPFYEGGKRRFTAHKPFRYGGRK